MPRGAIAKHQPGLLLKGGERSNGRFDAIVAPLGIAGHEQRRDALWLEVDRMLLDAAHPRRRPPPTSQMDNRVAPRMRWDATVLDVVVLLDGAVRRPIGADSIPGGNRVKSSLKSSTPGLGTSDCTPEQPARSPRSGCRSSRKASKPLSELLLALLSHARLVRGPTEVCMPTKT